MPRYLNESQVVRVGDKFAKLCKELSVELDKTYPELTNQIIDQLENEIKIALRQQKR